jgi:nucleoid-associated protein YgaU
MTSDAKIGLLLGLVFITIIAFLINGLPDTVTGRSDRGVNVDVSAIDDQFALGQHAEDVIEEIQEHYALPDERIVNSDQLDDPRFSTDDTQDKFGENFESVPAVGSGGKRMYLIKTGDNLAAIAKKFYGDEDGNKHANILWIFKANRDQLKSPDSIAEGQKIIIPPLHSASQTVITGNPAPGRLERVKNGLNRAINRQPKYKTYTVKDGDSMWQISAKLLGDGKRYREILKLNKSLISSAEEIGIAMKLKIPLK